MSSFIKYITAPYSLLVTAFGESRVGDPYKTLAEWYILSPFGWVEIYDYKSGHDHASEIDYWHMQADTEEAYDWVYAEVERAREAA